MYQGRHAFPQRNRRIVRQHFRIPPKRARPRFQAFKGERSRRPPQVVASQERLPASANVLLNRSIVFLPASRAFQLNHIQRFAHHRKSLAQAFLATLSVPPPPPTPHRHFERSRPTFSSAFAPANPSACAERNLSPSSALNLNTTSKRTAILLSSAAIANAPKIESPPCMNHLSATWKHFTRHSSDS